MHARPLCLAALLTLLSASPALADEGLAMRMVWMQTWLHKLDLSVQAGNAELAEHYLHELEEQAEEIVEDIETYEGVAVGQLVGELLVPALEAADQALDANAGDREAVVRLIGVCNQCHEASGHPAIRVVPASGNPFNQDFRPR